MAYKEQLTEILQKYRNVNYYYTDVSKKAKGAGIAVIDE